MEEETITREEHEYTLDDALAVYAAFAGQCMEMNEARLATALGAALRGCNALEVENDRLRSRLDDINLLACYASEENTDSRASVLLQRTTKMKLPLARWLP